MEVSMQRHRVPADRQPEIRSICLTIDFNPPQRAAIPSSGSKNPSNTMNGGKICICKGIIAPDGGVAGAQLVERTKTACGVDIANWFGIDQGSVKVQRLSWADLSHAQVADVEFQRRFSWFIGVNDQLGACEDKVRHSDLHPLAVAPETTHLLAVFLGRNVHRKAGHVNRV